MDKRASVFLLLLSLLPAGLAPGHIGPPSRPAPFPPPDYAVTGGEELLYEVSWWIVKLGTIRMRVMDAGEDSTGARPVVHADVDTYEHLPFASLHAVSETMMDEACYSVSSVNISQNGDAWNTIRYNYDSAQGRLFVERGTTPDRDSRQFSVKTVDTVNIDGRFQDGLSIFYFARANLLARAGMSVPTVVEGAEGRTVLHFPGERTSEEIDAVDYPIDVIAFRGVAEFSGIYGLSGDFEGWFSNDDARVPIKASMQVMLGSIDVELIGWHRDGWTPPRRPED
jgi:hypothetical protein